MLSVTPLRHAGRGSWVIVSNLNDDKFQKYFERHRGQIARVLNWIALVSVIITVLILLLT
jgi:hypothetical protein